MKVLLIINPQKLASQTLAVTIREHFKKNNIGVSSLTYTDTQNMRDDFDIAFSLGGDGTVLFAARTAACFGIPILPVNLGTLGFIATVPPEKWLETFEKWRNGAAVISDRLMLNVKVERQGKMVFELAALNDAVISASGIAKTIRLSAATKEFNLASYRSDGLIAATPTGSSAYSSSAGGPILDPELEAIILNPICPFINIRRPLVMPAGETIIITVDREQRSGVLLTIDGQVTEALESGDLVFISKSLHKVKLIGSDRRSFYTALHSKLALSSGF